MRGKRFAAAAVIVTVISFHTHQVFSSQGSPLPTFTALSAEADPHTGSANFAVPIEVPPGKGGIQPSVQLHYNSSSPNGILGVGWSLELGSVQHSSKGGVPRYDDTDTFVLIQNGGAQELVLDGVTGLYRGKTEGAFLKIARVGDYWEVTDKGGVKYTFGQTTGAKEYDPIEGSRVFKWFLERVEDLHGNYMTIDYARHENKLYPQDIRYTGNAQLGLLPFAHVAFEREARPENDIDHYNTGYRMSTRQRISRITVEVDGHLQRAYDLIYDDSRTTGRSLLTSVVQYGSDGVSSLPPVTFTYQTPKNPDFNYNVTPMNNSVGGDNLWNYRYSGGYDHNNGINYGPCPPPDMCYGGLNWGPVYTQSSGGNWSINSKGKLTFSAVQDAAYWFWTYLYVDGSNPKTLTVPYGTEGVDGVWINQNYMTSSHVSWTLQPGYNLVEMTFYNQNQGFGFDLNLDVADYVDLMSSSTVLLPQFSGDFNADGRTDIATFTAASGRVVVERSNGTVFSAKEVWINGFGVNGKPVSGDFNADGRMDFGSFDPASGNWKVALSDGIRFNDQGAAWISGFGAGEEPSAGDFNGDGLTDILTFHKASGNLYARIGLNKGGSFAALSGGENILIGSDSDLPIVGDFNGDGQVDFGAFNKASGTWDIRLNTGDILAGLRQLPTVSGFGAGRNTVVSDFNYDGLTDIGYYDDATGKVIYRVCQGSSFAPAVELPFVFNIKGPNTQIQSGDYNGDTLIDFAVYNLIGKLEIAFSNGVMPDILSSIENGLGGQSAITYDSAVHYPQTFLPFPIQVVKSLTKSNGLGESYTITNSYEQGLWDAPKREFRGFGLVRVTDPDGNYSDTIFAQDDVYKGRVIEQRTHDALGRLYGKTTNTWARQEIIPGSDFIYLQRKDNFMYDGDATGKRTAEEFFFEESPQYGNLTKAVQLGEVDLATGTDSGGDKRSVETAYVHNTARWLIGLPRLTTVQDNNGAIVRKTWFFYDNNANTSAPDKGFLTKKEDLAGDGTLVAAVVNPLTQYAYDAAGNLVSTTDSKGNVTTIAYDNAYGMFPAVTTNALGHRVVNEYYGVDGVPLDSGDGFAGLWGQLKSTTDPNNQAGRRVYDVFGRATAAVSPLDSLAFPTQTTAIEFLGSYTKVSARQRVEHGKPQTIDTVSFIDGFGRVAQTKTRTEVTGRYVVNGQARYDARGLKSKSYLPAFSTNPMDVIDVIDDTKPHTTVSYDAMGRVVRTTNPDGTYASVSYDDWTAIATDENGHRQKSYFDAYGRLIKKEEYLGADGRSPYYPPKAYTLYATTLYSYDSEGNLVQTKDAYNNVTTIAYDPLGRKVSMDDPDMGHWSYRYDLNGNLLSQTDAKGQTLSFAYDVLNRLTHKTDGVGGTVNVSYTYDTDSVSNAKGRLTQAAYPGGSTRFAYDELGRELQSIKEMSSRTYGVNRGYDALNRLAGIQYPDGGNVVYYYNAAGQIDGVASDPSLFTSVTLNVPELNLIQTGSTEVKLIWGNVVDATGYKIKYGTASGNYTTTLDAGGAISKVITGLTNDMVYYFAVAAYNADTESGNSNERSATPVAPPVLTVPSPWVQYAFNDSAANTTVTDTAGAAYNAVTEQTSLYTSDLTGTGSASASSCLWGCGNPSYAADKSFNNDFTSWDGWVSDNTQSGWLAYEFSTSYKINSYAIWPRGHIYPNDDGNPRDWTFEGFNSSTSGWDVLDSRSYSSWVWKNPVTFNFANDTAYSKYRLNISANGGHGEVGLTEMEMMAYAPLYTNTLSSAGMVNSSFSFNGSSHFVNADSLLAAKNHSVGSIALWVNPGSPSPDDVIFSLGDTDGSNRVEVRAANDLEFYIANSVLNLRVSLPNALVPGLWSHIVITQDGSGIKGYVNGNVVTVTVLDQGLGLDAWFNSTWGLDNARIGCVKKNNQGNHNYYAGRLDDFRYYDHPLTAAEVKALYNAGSGTEAKNPQYTDYTPLSKLEKEGRMAEKTVEYASRGTMDEGRETKSLLFSVAEWFERYVLGVGEAEAQTLPADGLVGHWAFDEASGTMASDISGNGYTATLVNMEETDHVQGKVAGALDFDGSNEYVNVPSPANWSVSSAVTLAAWVKIDTDKHGRIITKHGGSGDYGFMLARYLNNDSLEWRISTTGSNWLGGTTSVNSFIVGQWYHVAATYDGITMRVYVNGVENTGGSFPKAVSGNIRNSSAALRIGRDNNSSYLFDGLIDEARVYNRALTPTEVVALYQSGQASVPAAPALSTVTAGDGQVSLSWSAVTGATGYKVYYGTASGVYGTPLTLGNVTTTTVTGLTNGTVYYFAVSATGTGGESVKSNELNAAPSVPLPPAPVLNSAVAGSGGVSLSWSAASGATGYKVYYGTTSGVYGTPIALGNVTTTSVTGLNNGTKYYFAVSGTNTSGEGNKSNEWSATPADTTAPGVPANVTATAVSGSQVDLSWSASTDNVGVAGYRVYRDGVLAGTSVTTGYSDTGLSAGMTYSYTVSAFDAANNESAHSGAVSVTTPSGVIDDTAALYVTNVDYNAAGQMRRIEYGNGDVTEYTYNELNLRLTKVHTVNASGEVLQDLNYTYDSVGNILSITDNVNTADQAFQYDDLNRLVEATGQNYGAKTYVYDAIGNLVEKDGKTYFYGENGAGPHAVTSLSDGTAFSYDANGNMLSKAEVSGPAAVTTNYIYDAENRLVKVVKNGGTIGQYEYDGDGGRTKKVTSQGTTEFVGSIFEKSGGRETKFIFLGSQRVASVTSSSTLGSSTLYYHADHLGGANVLTDATGLTKELIEYEPFGLESRHEKYGSSEDVAWYYFTGKPKDDESGLIYFGARYYDPSLGRFITPDTIVQSSDNPQTFNRYTYSGNNPVNFIDPTGHFFWAAAIAIFKAVSAYAVAHPIIAGAVAGGVLGGANAAIQGTNVAQGIGLGVLGGAIGGGVGLGVGSYFEKGLGTFWAGVIGSGLGGATAGAATLSILGGDVGMGALAGLAGGVIAFSGSRVWPLGADAVAGGVSSVIQGGEFGDGAKMGAIDNAMMTMIDLAMPMETVKEQEIKPGDQVFIKPGKMDLIGWGINLLEGGAFSHVGIAVDNQNMVSAGPKNGVEYQPLKNYNNRQARVLHNFRGNQNVINAAKAQTVAKLPYNYVFGGRGRVCSTACGNAISVGAGVPWTGMGPNSQFNVFKSYGE